MYLNTYPLDHVFFSQTRMLMALLMGEIAEMKQLIADLEQTPTPDSAPDLEPLDPALVESDAP